MTAALIVVAVTLTGPPSSPAQPAQPAQPVKCMISAIDEVNVPAVRIGALMTLAVRAGDEVDKETLLASIDDRDARAGVRVAQFRQQQAAMQADNQLRVQAASLAAAVAELEYTKSKSITERSRDAISEIELERLKLQWEQLKLTRAVEERSLEEAKLLAQERQEEVVVAEMNRDDRQVKSPIRGVVAEIFHEEGEWLQQGEPILRIIRMDRLKAEAYVKLDEILPPEIADRTISINVKIAGRTLESFAGRVTFVSPEVEPGGRYRIEAEIDNKHWAGSKQWILRPGMIVEFQFDKAATLRNPK